MMKALKTLARDTPQGLNHSPVRRSVEGAEIGNGMKKIILRRRKGLIIRCVGRKAAFDRGETPTLAAAFPAVPVLAKRRGVDAETTALGLHDGRKEVLHG
jgi:hypothetical protein